MNLARFCRRGFFQNVMVVMTSTGLAQLFTICFSPVISRLYDPGDFAVYGTFLSVTGVLSAVVTLQYSEALMLPGKHEEAAALFWAAGLSAVTMTLLLSIPWFLFPSWWLTLFKIPQLNGWLWLVPLAALVTGFNQTLTAWCARHKAFRRAATAQVARSLTANSAQTVGGAGGIGAGGLIGGGLLGDLLANLGLFFWIARTDGPALHAGAHRQQIVAAAHAHRDFAFYSTPQNLLNAISQGAPVVLLIYYFGAAVGGTYAFAIRVLELPINFVLTSVRQVLFQKLSEVHNSGGDLAALFAKGTGMLLAMALGPTALGLVFAPRLFALVFGSEWSVAGEYARWLLIWFLGMFCNLPAGLLARILRLQRNLLFFDIALLILRMAVLIGGGTFLSPMRTIALFSLVGATFNALLILYVWRVLKSRTRSAAPTP
ncbi:MAG: oligosaccharide flippase family protein [Verrucomicrobia bacterium]|nr:oligosaccharide flippase family protein [Verrucomicrobiota bacterium]